MSIECTFLLKYIPLYYIIIYVIRNTCTLNEVNILENTMIFANDLGYGYLKAAEVFEDETAYNNAEVNPIPSVIAVQREQDLSKPVEFDNDTQKDDYFENFLDHMDLSISSSSVRSQGRFLVGQAALDSHLSLRSFDVNDYIGKAENDISVILTLSVIAGMQVKKLYKNGQDLTDPIKVKVKMATGLPIMESKQVSVSEHYEQKFMDSKHTVTFHNFSDPITVVISFEKVYVGREGELAQLYINFADDKLRQSIINNFKENYPTLAKDVQSDDLFNAQNVLGIDIGAGTTDIVSVIDGKVNVAASSSLPVGYGSVLQDAVDFMVLNRININDRSQLAAFLAEPATALSRSKKQKVEQIVEAQEQPFVDKIIDATSKAVRLAGANVDLAYVYGGGSIPMKSTDLHDKLTKKLSDGFNGGITIPVIWIDDDFAQDLNLMGLYLLAQQL